MSRTPQRRLRAAIVSITVAAGLVVAALPALAADTAVASAQSGQSGQSAPAPAAAGTASGFTFYVQPVPQPVCSTISSAGLNATADPALDRDACGFAEFQVSGATGAVTADLYADGSDTPFVTGLAAAEDTAEPGTFQVSLEPAETWPTGRIRLVVKDTTGSMGEFFFAHNPLVAELTTTPASTTAGTPFDVTGTIEVHSARSTFTGVGLPPATTVPADLTVEVVDAEGAVLDTQDVTAGSDGTFTVNVPAEATEDLTENTTVAVRAVDARYTDSATPPGSGTGDWASAEAGASSHAITVAATTLRLENSFVSSVGWVKPGDTYPSQIVVANPTAGPLTPTVQITAPTGSTILSAGPDTVGGQSYTWSPGAIAAGDTRTLVLESQAATTAAEPTIVWRDLSTTAVMTVSSGGATAVSHGPKVIPPSEVYDTARYGDRPFPVVPVQYTDRDYQADHSGEELEGVINDPANEGSTFNLYQEMSLGQLFPEGTVPSAGIGSADFASYADGFAFSKRAVPGNTCQGFTYEDFPGGATANPLYTERITDGVYNLPGDTGYYGSDSNGSAVVGSVGGVGALQNIDSGCGDTGKLVYDAAALSDPEIDYSDYDTDKDGVVDFFMVVFAGCGGNGASQLGPAGCDYPGAPYDNVWPHSSSLENGYSDPVTGLPGYTTDDQLEDLEGNPQYWTDDTYSQMTDDPASGLEVYVRVGPYNVNPETAIDFASVISHEYGHSLGLPDFYSTGNRETYGSWTLMAEDRSQNIDAFGRQELGWVVPQVLDSSGPVSGMKDSKQDIGRIVWQDPSGSEYTLEDGPDGTVHNSEMYVAKLPGRTLLDAAAFDVTPTSEGASASHLWWSGSGNDFGCAPTEGHNFDLSIPQLSGIPADSTVSLSFKSRWDVEWDYDYGFVLTTTDGGATYQSNPSEEGYTTSTTSDPTAPANNACQTGFDNGLTGSSGSYQAGTETVDRATSTYPEPVFLTDTYDVSELAGQANGALRFSYATDPGLARPGWFIDDVTLTVTEPGGTPYDVLVTDFETSGGPDDARVFNGGCREDLSTAQKCTLGWKYLQAGAASVQDHAYYLEMRDRSGFDLDGNGEADRGAADFAPGLYLSYTDEAHGYGNAGTDDPPAQSPLDAVPEPGSETPELNDAAFTAAAGRSSYSDSGAGHTDNYTDPSTESGNWEFTYDCLGFDVTSMSGEDVGPEAADGNLTGDVAFTIGSGCGDFNYGYEPDPAPGANTAPTAAAKATPSSAVVGQNVTLSAEGSTDAETPNNLVYSWDFGDGGSTKDASGKTVVHAFAKAGTYVAKVSVSDPDGLNATALTTVTVTQTSGPGSTGPVARIQIRPKHPGTDRKVRFNGKLSTGTGVLTYAWNFHNGGKVVDSRRKRAKAFIHRVGKHKVTLTVTDGTGATARTTVGYRVWAHHSNQATSHRTTVDPELFRGLAGLW